jgi:hypothetical protein
MALHVGVRSGLDHIVFILIGGDQIAERSKVQFLPVIEFASDQ